MFYLAEYVNMTNGPGPLATTVFSAVGGRRWPPPSTEGANTGWGLLVVRPKVWTFMFVFTVACAGTVPRRARLRPVHGAGLEVPDPGILSWSWLSVGAILAGPT